MNKNKLVLLWCVFGITHAAEQPLPVVQAKFKIGEIVCVCPEHDVPCFYALVRRAEIMPTSICALVIKENGTRVSVDRDLIFPVDEKMQKEIAKRFAWLDSDQTNKY